MEYLDKVVELLRSRTDAKEKWNLYENKEYTADKADDGEYNRFGEDIGYTEGNTEKYCEDTGPLSIDTEVPGLEFTGNITEDRHRSYAKSLFPSLILKPRWYVQKSFFGCL